MKKNSHIKIILEDMQVNVRIGLHPHEQENGRSQAILVNVELFANSNNYLHDATHQSIINYDYIHDAIRDWADRPHVMLIETYVSELMDICFREQKVEAAKISITKPDIFDDVERVGVEAFMTRDDWIN